MAKLLNFAKFPSKTSSLIKNAIRIQQQVPEQIHLIVKKNPLKNVVTRSEYCTVNRQNR